MTVSGSSLMKKSSSQFTTREINPWVIFPGLIALFAFFIILRYVLTFGQSSTNLIALVFFGTIAFPMLLSPLYTTIRITEDRIDWKVFGRLGTVIYLGELREIRVHHRLFVKLDTGRWWKPSIFPADRNGFLRAIRKAKPDLAITGWKLQNPNDPKRREKKLWWMLCIILPLMLVPAITLFFFPETPLSTSLVYAVASSVGVLLAYFVYMRKTVFKIQPKTLQRIIFIAFGAFTVGSLSWAFIVLPLASYLDIPGTIVILLLFVLMVVCAFVVDIIMKRRDYRPFMERRGNI